MTANVLKRRRSTGVRSSLRGCHGIRLHYVDEGDGPLVIMLHGFPYLWYLWRHQIKVLAAAGYREELSPAEEELLAAKWSAAGLAVRPWHWLRSTTIQNSVPTRRHLNPMDSVRTGSTSV